MSMVWARVIRGLGAFAGILVAGSVVVSAQAQTPPASAPAPKFAAVSIRLYQHGDVAVGPPGQNFYSNPAGLHVFFSTLNDMICYAYSINRAQVTGGPRWAMGYPGPYKSRYVLDAATSAPATEAQERVMLQNALAARFGLKMTIENQPVKVMALVVAKGGPKLKRPKPGEIVPLFSWKRAPDAETVRTGTTAELVKRLNQIGIAQIFGRFIVDDTGLTGKYDITIRIPR